MRSPAPRRARPTCCSTGCRTETPTSSTTAPLGSAASSPERSRSPSARTEAGHRAAGVVRPCRACRSRSRTLTRSIWPTRRSSAARRPTVRSRGRSAPDTCHRGQRGVADADETRLDGSSRTRRDRYRASRPIVLSTAGSRSSVAGSTLMTAHRWSRASTRTRPIPSSSVVPTHSSSGNAPSASTTMSARNRDGSNVRPTSVAMPVTLWREISETGSASKMPRSSLIARAPRGKSGGKGRVDHVEARRHPVSAPRSRSCRAERGHGGAVGSGAGSAPPGSSATETRCAGCHRGRTPTVDHRRNRARRAAPPRDVPGHRFDREAPGAQQRGRRCGSANLRTQTSFRQP